jgi:phosphate transport system substrate-binding protein
MNPGAELVLILDGLGTVLRPVAIGALALSACGTDNNTNIGAPAYDQSSVHVACGGTKLLNASGSTAQANAMARFVNVFEQVCPSQTLNYTANGSGAGITQFLGKQTDFGGSDVPLSTIEYAKAQQRCDSPAWNLPMVFGPIAITYNLKGIDSLNLDGPTIAKIFNGTVTTWDDAAIKALNATANLPAEPVHVIFRSDESGTTANFQDYLDTASNGAWGKGVGKAFRGGVGEGAKGNEGTSAAVKNTQGSITYNEWSFAQAQKLKTARIITAAGPEPVSISAGSVGKTIAGAAIAGRGNDLVLDTTSFYEPRQPGAYPIVLATYEIVCSKYPDPRTGTAVKAFLQSAIGPGQNGLANNGYVPIPDEFKSRLSASVDAIG